MDFVIPLFAGELLGLTAAETGVLIAVGLLFSFTTRPVAGICADRYDRRWLSVAGLVVLALGCGLYGVAGGMPLALTAAALTGVGEAFVWVALRSIVGSRVREESGVFARLMAAEELGGWVIVVPGILLLSAVGYRPVFWAAAACCLVAVGYMAVARRLASSPADVAQDSPAAGLDEPPGRIRPMLVAVAVIMMAEAAISLLLMLHLQRHFQLDPIEVAYVFLPGAIALSVLPPYLHQLTARIGRRRMLVLGSLSGTGFAAGMAFAGSPLVIAVLWILSAASWAATIPIHQAVVTEAAGVRRIGRALSSYEAACIAGAFVGSLAAGTLYDVFDWTVTCLVVAAVVLLGAVLAPAALRTTGVSDRPAPEPVAATSPVVGTRGKGGDDAESAVPDATTDAPAAPGDRAAPVSPGERVEPTRDKLVKDLGAHTGLFAVVMVAAAVLVPGVTFAGLLGIGPDTIQPWAVVGDVFAGRINPLRTLGAALRVWVFIWVIDVLWTAYKLITLPRDAEGQHKI